MGNVLIAEDVSEEAKKLPEAEWLANVDPNDFDVFVHDCSAVAEIVTELQADEEISHHLSCKFEAYEPKFFIAAMLLCSHRLHDKDKVDHLWTLLADDGQLERKVFSESVTFCCRAVDALLEQQREVIAEPDLTEERVELDLAKWWISSYPAAQHFFETLRGSGRKPLPSVARPVVSESAAASTAASSDHGGPSMSLGFLGTEDPDVPKLRIRDLVESGLVDGAWVDSVLRKSPYTLDTEVSLEQYLKHMVPRAHQEVCRRQFERILADSSWFGECRQELTAETDDLSMVARARDDVLQTKLSTVLGVVDQTLRAIADKEHEIRELEHVRRSADDRIKDERDRLARLRATLVYVQRQVDEVHRASEPAMTDVQHVFQRHVTPSSGYRSTPSRRAARVHPRASLSRSGPARGRALLSEAERNAKRDHLRSVWSAGDSPGSHSSRGRRLAVTPAKEAQDTKRQARQPPTNPGPTTAVKGTDPFKDFLKEGTEEDATLATAGHSEESKVEAFRRFGKFEQRHLRRAVSESSPQKLFEDNKFYTQYGWSVERKRHDKVQLSELEIMKASLSQQDWHRSTDSRTKLPSLRSLQDVKGMQKTMEHQHKQLGSVLGLPATRPERAELRNQRDLANAMAATSSSRPDLLLGDGISNLRARMRLVKQNVATEQGALLEESATFSEAAEDKKLAQKYDLALKRVLEIRSGFSKSDRDGSGFVDKEEFRYVMGKVCRGAEIRENQFDTWWKAVDRNNNGKIEFEEFMVWLSTNPVFREQEFLKGVSRKSTAQT
mmetsp:Transcript_17202/g.37912  ORF Transcript_17202/g.37912 Transcript_17202/m.37912 type:complete len:782 (+) Transcript_17202:75-2420(+)